MSMLSSQIDKLRRMADGQATYRDAREVMLQAADTITELRDDLQRANDATQDAEHDESVAWDRACKAEAENAKLRELVRDMMVAWWACDNERCPRHDKRCEEGKFCAFDECARDLGIEVDE